VQGKTVNREDVVEHNLGSYEIGAKIRQLRLRKKLGLVDLGRHTAMSASMLSQLENGKMMPTLSTLMRIAMVFDVGLEFFFAERRHEKRISVVRKQERMQFPDHPDSPKPNYFFECLAFSSREKSMQAYLAEFPERAESELEFHSHDGAEFLHVLEGTLGVTYERESYTLNEGDSAYFDASEPHAYRGMTGPVARALVITTPPRI
jgi:transcriptional regulator with XRE-family HTH domain